ncbi:hypothetical protein LQK89_17065 (plasmid) [Curtobacterium sp. C1]|jgi:hypothetical protein|uniref:hypothetical protein n=1 Tax=Curtobacterium TaxID=2034 RepID=UPI001E38202F|nr:MULTISPECIES: hypothetical protein [Curtobacterium]MCE0459500.1 hypothetical protein [Curtobacterium allii]UFU15880.1 hypothetical protein LQK89_17065 [Curtobacterium sp. C1]
MSNSSHDDNDAVGVTRGSLIRLAVGAALLAASIAAAGTICYACFNPAFPS